MRWLVPALLAALALAAGAADWRAPAPVASQAEAPPPALEEAALLALRPAEPLLARLAGAPRVFVLVFPSLGDQAAAMNRLAALAEKAGFPRDRLATPAELAAHLAASGDAAETWYLAHDYGAASLGLFARLAAEDPALSPAEARLAALVPRLAALAEGRDHALLSIAAETPGLDEAARAAMLRHEVAHGRFLAEPAVAARVLAAWGAALTEAERAALRTHLGREGYDTADETLMANEAMAYLGFTPDTRLFDPAALGFSAERAAALRALYEAALSGLPE